MVVVYNLEMTRYAMRDNSLSRDISLSPTKGEGPLGATLSPTITYLWLFSLFCSKPKEVITRVHFAAFKVAEHYSTAGIAGAHSNHWVLLSNALDMNIVRFVARY